MIEPPTDLWARVFIEIALEKLARNADAFVALHDEMLMRVADRVGSPADHMDLLRAEPGDLTTFGRNGQIGLLTTGIHTHYEDPVAAAIRQELALKGFGVIHRRFKEDPILFACELGLILKTQPAGIIVMPPPDGKVFRMAQRRLRQSVPTVALDRPLDPDISFVGNENIKSSMQAVDALLQEGYRRFIVVEGNSRLRPVAERQAGVLGALDRSIHDLRIERVPVRDDFDAGSNGMRKLTRAIRRFGREDKVAVWADNAAHARAAAGSIARELGVVPDGWQVRHFDAASESGLTSIGARGCAVDHAEIGTKAAKALLRLIGRRSSKPVRVTVPAKVERA